MTIWALKSIKIRLYTVKKALYEKLGLIFLKIWILTLLSEDFII
jgi:uncharacterized membrane protein YwzB